MEKINLSTSTNITTTYAGEFAGKYIAAALLSAPTLDKEYITLKPNIKYKEVIKKYNNTNVIFEYEVLCYTSNA